MARKSPYKVLPEETGGLTTYQAQKLLEEFLYELSKKVEVGHWRSKVDTHKKLGTIVVQLELNIWKKGWSPPPEALMDNAADLKKKATRKASTQTSASPKSSKKAR
jgi:hypothetical protein